MALHEARVLNRVVRCGDTDAAIGFLEDDGEDETSIDASGVGDGLDAVGHVVQLVVGVIGNVPLGTRAGHDVFVGLEPKASSLALSISLRYIDR